MAGILPCALCLLMLASVAAACRSGQATTPGVSTGGTLNLFDTGPVTLDPATASDSGSGMYIMQIFSGLVHIDGSLKVQPDIAQSWDVSPDGITYTFHLRHDVTFQDGTPVKASDFKYSWERALSPATQSLTAGTYLNDIVGASDMLSGKATQLSGVTAPDDYTLQVKIDAPKAYFIYKMAYPTAFVVEKSNVGSGSQWWQHPVGTGPFKLQKWVADQELVLTRYAGFYGDKAKVDSVDFNLYNGDPMSLYQLNEIDVVYIGGDYLAEARDPTNPISQELKVFPQLSSYYIGFNTTTPPFDDVNVRLAFTYAVDKEKLIYLADQNQVTVAYGILPPGMPAYNANLQGLHFDPVKARQLLAASKYGGAAGLLPIVLTTSGYGGYISGELGGLINDWKTNLGVDVTVRQLESDVYYYSLQTEKNNLFDTGWIADYPDPQDFLDILFHSGRENNYGGYSNPQVDALLDKAAVEQNQDARFKEYQQAEQAIVNDAAVLPISFSNAYALIKPWVTGYDLSPLGYVMLNQVSVGPKPPTGGTAR